MWNLLKPKMQIFWSLYPMKCEGLCGTIAVLLGLNTGLKQNWDDKEH